MATTRKRPSKTRTPLNRERVLQAAVELADRDGLEALLLFETSNIRYLTSTHIGYWAFNKGERYALITRNGDFRSASS